MMQSWKIKRLKRCRSKKGAVLIEFAISALLFFTVLLATVEFGVEIYVKNTTERLTNRVAETYALTRSTERAQEVLENEADVITSRCIQEPRFVVFDDITGLDILRDAGRAPSEGLEMNAVAFRVEVDCDWPRITPVMGGMLGTVGAYHVVHFGSFRMEGN